MNTTAPTDLSVQPDAPSLEGESPAGETAQEQSEESLRTRVVRAVLLAVLPCRRFLEYGVAPDEDLSTSDSTRMEQEAGLTYLGSLEVKKIEEVLAKYEDLHREEEARKSSTEARLTTVLGMSSIVSAITFGFVSTAFEKLRTATPGWIGLTASVVFLYAAIQLVISIWHAVHGLQVCKISELAGSELLWRPAETEQTYLLRRVRYYSQVVDDHDRVNGGKTRRLKLAHHAVLNFLRAVLVLIIPLAWAGWSQGVGESKTWLGKQLRSDPELVEMLRGPRGDHGDLGPTGSVGPPGPPGATAICPRPLSAR